MPGPVKAKLIPRKKTPYAKLGLVTQTYSTGCEFVAGTYKLTNPKGKGETDGFILSTARKYEQNGTKYKGTMNFDVHIDIGQ